MSWTAWIVIPLLGSAIGYVTNWVAVRMIFRPLEPRRILGLRVQGLIGRRQRELAESIGEVVGDHLVQHDDIIRILEKVDLEELLSDVVEQGMAAKIESLRSLPLVGGFLNEERVAGLHAGVVQGILKHRNLVFERLEQAVEAGLDVKGLVRDKVAAFPVERLEGLVLKIAARELRAIELLGAVLGAIIGILQVVVV